MSIILGIIVGYLIGSIPSALIAGKTIKGIDIREYGSGNMGAANAYRILGREAGTVVIAADVFKGIIPALIGLYIGGYTVALIAGIAAVIGHSYPVFARFKGGKGIATGAGAYLVILPFGLLISLAVFLAVFLISGYVSLSSIIAVAVLAIMSFVFYKGAFVSIATLLICAFAIYRHRENIIRLWEGTESKSKIWK